MIKNFQIDPNFGYGYTQDTHGGQDIRITASADYLELLNWWKEWRDVMKNTNPTVVDAIQQLKVVHALTKEQEKNNPQPSMIP
jgi:hypothetical protein